MIIFIKCWLSHLKQNYSKIWKLKSFFVSFFHEPFFLRVIAFFVFFLGNTKLKILFDLIPRQHYALSIQRAFKTAKNDGINKIYLLEFGVGAGGGLININRLAKLISKSYDLDYEIIGFDTGSGLPQPVDYRDHPEIYSKGDYPDLQFKELKLPPKTRMFYGDIKETLNQFIDVIIKKKDNSRIGFISIDVDYYSSTNSALNVLMKDQSLYLSKVVMYFDDVLEQTHNKFAGELLSIDEFNKSKNIYRKITPIKSLKYSRIFRNSSYLQKIFHCHIFDSNLVDSDKKLKRQIALR